MEIDHHKKTEDASDSGNAPWWQPALALFGRLSAWIAGPVLIGALIGDFVDKKYGFAPWGKLSIIGISFIFSMIGLVVEASKEFAKIEKSVKDKDKKNDTQ